MYWLSTTTPTSGLCSRSHEAAWIPSSVPVGGIRMSVTTTSGDVVLNELQEFREVGRPADEIEVGLAVDDARDALPEECIVLRQNHPDARHAKRTVARSKADDLGVRSGATPGAGRGGTLGKSVRCWETAFR